MTKETKTVSVDVIPTIEELMKAKAKGEDVLMKEVKEKKQEKQETKRMGRPKGIPRNAPYTAAPHIAAPTTTPSITKQIKQTPSFYSMLTFTVDKENLQKALLKSGYNPQASELLIPYISSKKAYFQEKLYEIIISDFSAVTSNFLNKTKTKQEVACVPVPETRIIKRRKRRSSSNGIVGSAPSAESVSPSKTQP
jgi:hypothetical protein